MGRSGLEPNWQKIPRMKEEQEIVTPQGDHAKGIWKREEECIS